MMARSKCSNQRPDTLMQDRSPPARRNHLQHTAGPYIRVKSGKAPIEYISSALAPIADIRRRRYPWVIRMVRQFRSPQIRWSIRTDRSKPIAFIKYIPPGVLGRRRPARRLENVTSCLVDEAKCSTVTDDPIPLLQFLDLEIRLRQARKVGVHVFVADALASLEEAVERRGKVSHG